MNDLGRDSIELKQAFNRRAFLEDNLKKIDHNLAMDEDGPEKPLFILKASA